MSTIQIKTDLHRIIDSIDNVELLQALRDFLKNREDVNAGNLLSLLSAEQQDILTASFQESKNDSLLIPRSEIWKEM